MRQRRRPQTPRRRRSRRPQTPQRRRRRKLQTPRRRRRRKMQTPRRRRRRRPKRMRPRRRRKLQTPRRRRRRGPQRLRTRTTRPRRSQRLQLRRRKNWRDRARMLLQSWSKKPLTLLLLRVRPLFKKAWMIKAAKAKITAPALLPRPRRTLTRSWSSSLVPLQQQYPLQQQNQSPLTLLKRVLLLNKKAWIKKAAPKVVNNKRKHWKAEQELRAQALMLKIPIRVLNSDQLLQAPCRLVTLSLLTLTLLRVLRPLFLRQLLRPELLTRPLVTEKPTPIKNKMRRTPQELRRRGKRRARARMMESMLKQVVKTRRPRCRLVLSKQKHWKLQKNLRQLTRPLVTGPARIKISKKITAPALLHPG
mmetsp:Transcript_16469/g.40753  ORF Transcript_16469/g.40753 Transcript_16469/m.40753 type:complete len:362 (+) Transcript_16469:693-1778(+)